MLHLYISAILKIKLFQLWGLDEEIGCLRSKTSEYVSLQSLNWIKLLRGEMMKWFKLLTYVLYILSYASLLGPLDRWVIAKNGFLKTHTKSFEQRTFKWKYNKETEKERNISIIEILIFVLFSEYQLINYHY